MLQEHFLCSHAGAPLSLVRRAAIRPWCRSLPTHAYSSQQFELLQRQCWPCRSSSAGAQHRIVSSSAGNSTKVEEATESRPAQAYGQVMSAQANFVSVVLDMPNSDTQDASDVAGEKRTELLCTVRGILKKIKQSVLVGDRVRVAGIDWDDQRGTVDDVLPRRSELQDPAVANVDQVLLVFALERPPLDFRTATRFLVSTEAAELPATVVLNKADLVPAEECSSALAEIQSWGYDAIAVSAATGLGLDKLAEVLQGRVSVVAGPSGVGKSSLINAIKLQAHIPQSDDTVASSGNGSPGEAAASSAADVSTEVVGADGQLVREDGSGGGRMGDASNGVVNGESAGARTVLEPVEQWRGMQEAAARLGLQPVGDLTNLGRGKHTTRHVSLLEVAGGLLADSPGFNQPSLENVTLATLADCFPEVREKAESCAFKNCQHLIEPGCAVREGWSRHELYEELHEEVKAAEELARVRSASKKRREGSVRYKSAAGGARTREALLDIKSHRRVSRRQGRQGLQDLLQEAERDE
ncbi:probable small ribosomal subunit biogenesis GTPase RsgA [Coccomyxa sp. Obi]|nr:probable small ribosomal subunit biogenesis GTPase RsgA [Coccomyxa sp. Obi]